MQPTPQEVREQLDRILLSQEFQASEGLAGFLRFVVEETLAGRADEINQRTVGIKGLGYAANFDSQSNPAVRMQASRLRRALGQYYLTQGIKDRLRIEIPKGGYVPVCSANGDHTLQTELAIESSISQAVEAGQSASLTGGPSVAIMPLKYLGDEAQYEYFSDGITEEIVIAMTRFPELQVIGPLDRETVRRKQLGPRGIGRQYNVRFLLDGTVRLRDQSLRITSKLTDTRSGRQIWGQAHDYDIEATSIDQLESEIVGQVVAVIADNFGVIPRTLAREALSHQNDSLSDYAAILRFDRHNRNVTAVSLHEATAALEEVVARNPENDHALALLADAIGAPYWLGYVDDMTGLERAERLARKAIALNPDSQQAHFAMAQIHYSRSEVGPCMAEIEQVLALNPNRANSLAISALFLMGLGHWERSLGLVQKAMRLSPHYPGWYHLIPFLYHYYHREYEPALIEANGFNTPDYYLDPLIRAAALGQVGHREESTRVLNELLALLPDFEARGQNLVKRILVQDEYVAMIWDGLAKAGLG